MAEAQSVNHRDGHVLDASGCGRHNARRNRRILYEYVNGGLSQANTRSAIRVPNVDTRSTSKYLIEDKTVVGGVGGFVGPDRRGLGKFSIGADAWQEAAPQLDGRGRRQL